MVKAARHKKGMMRRTFSAHHSGATRSVSEPLYVPLLAAARAEERRITIRLAVVAGPFEQSPGSLDPTELCCAVKGWLGTSCVPAVWPELSAHWTSYESFSLPESSTKLPPAPDPVAVIL
jgi:hypothetical protein